jgi:hypothetical protein
LPTATLGQLYDLENDPHEMDNCSRSGHRGVRAELMEKLAARDGTRRSQPDYPWAAPEAACESSRIGF